MRLLLILPEFPPSFGGMQTHALALANRLLKRGHTVQVMSYQAVTHSDRQACSECDAALPFPVVRSLSRLGHYENLRKITAEATSFKADVIYASTIFYGKAGEASGIPVVCRSPGNDVLRPWIAWPFKPLSALMSQPWFETGFYRLIRRLDYPKLLERIYHKRRREVVEDAARHAGAILANSDFSAQFLREAGVGDDQLVVVPGGVDADRFSDLEQAASDDSFIILTACRLVHKKGVDFLIRSMPELAKRIPNIRLVVVGDGPKRKKYQRLITSLDLDERVTITGAVPQSEMQNWIATADIFVLASRLVVDEKTGNCDAETMGRVLCEANAAGKPVIAANSGGIPSVVAHEVNGLLFEPDDETQLIAAIERIRLDDELRKQLIENGLNRAHKEFDWSIITDIHEDRFKKLTGGNPEPALDHV